MHVKLSVLLFALAAVAVLGQKKKPAGGEWNYRDGADRVNMRGVANLTQVLDNWRFDILGQMRNQLQNDHQSLLPDYARIQPLSEALDDLFKEFNALKTHLGDLSEKLVSIEDFIDKAKAEKLARGGPTAAATVKRAQKVIRKDPAP